MPVHIHIIPMSNIKIDKTPEAVETNSGKIVNIGVEVMVQKFWCRRYDDLKWWLQIIYNIRVFSSSFFLNTAINKTQGTQAGSLTAYHGSLLQYCCFSVMKWLSPLGILLLREK